MRFQLRAESRLSTYSRYKFPSVVYSSPIVSSTPASTRTSEFLDFSRLLEPGITNRVSYRAPQFFPRPNLRSSGFSESRSAVNLGIKNGEKSEGGPRKHKISVRSKRSDGFWTNKAAHFACCNSKFDISYRSPDFKIPRSSS